ncbi:triacylglycerol lipase [Roseibium hamelinense]|uniref:Triacylglycerol lipase n=1 Tax=Roseibium hamelinense TaxID=150831 RepID=A0A562THE0_9HYPH|nr:M10 family metallopeptidase C-terminal domain-containing protein [Roseibium hamelinense]MTI46036.1 triacylglycerol lipase [Roseibium hamelinense]TWI92773.1 triacylglycerol lipase [Roseibium hamelinense]
MPLFTYKNGDASSLVSNAIALSAYANQTYASSVQAGDISIDVSRGRSEGGWTVLAPDVLGYDGIVDGNGTYNGETNQFKDAQAEVFARYDASGEVTGVGLAIRGTGGPEEDQVIDTIGDVIDYLEFLKSEPQYVENAFGNLLVAIRDFLTANGLTASDLIVTGHSLGGGAVTNMAERSDDILDGYFVDANYIGFASHYTPEDGSSVLSSGAELFSMDFENDPVPSVISDGRINVLGNDTDYGYDTSNLIFYNDYYGTPLYWDGGNVINPFAWSAHSSANYAKAVNVVLSSKFYDEMSRDSLVIVSGLSEDKRDDRWVEDEFIPFDNTGHLGDAAFILGSEGGDWLRGNRGNDTIEGFGGDDHITAGKGNDRICDGTGSDVLTGGKGADIFIFVNDGTKDTITDFKRGEDKIDLSYAGVSAFDELSFDDKGWFGNFDILYDQDILSLEKGWFSGYSNLAASDFIFAA